IIDALRSADGKQAIVFAVLGEDSPVPMAHVENVRATGTPFFRSPERAFRALAAVKKLARVAAVEQATAIAPAARRAVAPLEPGTLPEYRAKQLLASRGLKMPPSRLVTS